MSSLQKSCGCSCGNTAATKLIDDSLSCDHRPGSRQSKNVSLSKKEFFVHILQFRRVTAFVLLAATIIFLQAGNSPAHADQLPQVPVPGMVTMVDLGAKKCIPCKMMAPILQELQQEYAARAAVIFIDVWERPEAGPKFALRTIPTQIFYDAQGREITRHEGFLDKQSIVDLFTKLGVE